MQENLLNASLGCSARNAVKKIIDTRLHPSSQLSGFAKATDLEYFARHLENIGYEHQPEFAPTQDILDAYRKKEIDWATYEQRYLDLLDSRALRSSIDIWKHDHHCFLCSEHSPEQCHRRLLVQYLVKGLDSQIVHLM